MNTTTVRVVDTNDGTILWEGNSVSHAKVAMKAQVEYSRRINQGAGRLAVKKYIGDGEWSVVARPEAV